MLVSKNIKRVLTSLPFIVMAELAFAEESAKGIGKIAGGVTSTLQSVGTLLVAMAFLAGFGFLVFGILKFKQHKDNPTQVPLGTPVVMTIIGAMLCFVGGFIQPLGETFGVKPSEAGGFTGKGASEVPGSGSGSPS